MSPCRCCGQAIRASAASSPWIDRALADCCRRSQLDAQRRGAAEEGIGHFLFAALSDPSVAALFAALAIDATLLARHIDVFLTRGSGTSAATDIPVSDDLKILLARTLERMAAQHRPVASLADALETLFCHGEDIGSARLVAHWRNASHVGRSGIADTLRPMLQHREPTSAAPVLMAWAGVPVPQRSSWAQAHTLDEITARLARQEHLLAELGAQLARIADAGGDRSDASRHAAARSRSSATKTQRSSRTGTAASYPPRPLFSWRRSGGAGGGPRQSWSRPTRAAPLAVTRDHAVLSRTSTPKAVAARADTQFENDNDADEGNERRKRFYLTLDDEIVRAPSIGPRMAERMAPHGILRVRDLLGCDAGHVAKRIGGRGMSKQRIIDWQDQARLVCTVPWLRGTHAQLLVGAGYNTVGKIRDQEASLVCAAILRFATTREGQSILRASPPPETDRILRWIGFSALAELERASPARTDLPTVAAPNRLAAADR